MLLCLPVFSPAEDESCSVVYCANLQYGGDKTSECFSQHFLEETAIQTHIRTAHEFKPVGASSRDLFAYPFAVMSGEGAFTLTGSERANLGFYLENGGFLVASAGCSSKNWQESFTQEILNILPTRKMVQLEADHPIFHTVSDVTTSQYTSGDSKFPDLYGIEIDGRVVLVYSPDGLNDTAGVDDEDCCCCGGNEIKAAKFINMNLLAFALTH
jgi:hypothetical protein